MEVRLGDGFDGKWRVSGLRAEDPLGAFEEPQVSLEVWGEGFVMAGGYLVLKLEPSNARALGRTLIEMADHAESRPSKETE